LTGDIVIDCRAAGFLPEFSVTSEKPLSEWAGFGACPIKF